MKGRSRFRFRYRGIMGALAQALGSLFDKILNDEETAGNDNVFYNPQDLTSLRVETDGSGGSPAVGDPVGMMLDTSGLSGSMEEFLAGAPDELNGAGAFDSATGWTLGTSWSISGGTASSASGSAGNLSYTASIADNTWCKVTLDVIGGTFGSYLVSINGGTSVAFDSTVESKTLYVLSGSSSSDVVIAAGSADGRRSASCRTAAAP